VYCKLAVVVVAIVDFVILESFWVFAAVWMRSVLGCDTASFGYLVPNLSRQQSGFVLNSCSIPESETTLLSHKHWKQNTQ
jgi:hypothetical protein